MNTIFVPDKMSAMLKDAKQQLDVRDVDGKLLGRFIPESEYSAMMEKIADLEFNSPLSTTERESSIAEMNAGKCVSTEELLSELDGSN